MINIIRSQLYQMVRQRNLRGIFIGFSAFSVLYGLMGILNATDDVGLSGAHVVATTLSMVSITALMLMSIFVGYICADDFTDKTSNYDIMSGSLRRQAYFGRAIVAVATSVIVALAHVLIMVITAAIASGWGYELSVGAVVLRLFLMTFILIRMSCFYVLLSYIVKKPIAVIALNFAMMGAFSVLGDYAGQASMITGIGSLTYICSFEVWTAFGLNTANRFVFEPAIAANTVISLIVTSLIFAAAYLIIGYVYFHHDDLE